VMVERLLTLARGSFAQINKVREGIERSLA
jgi:hypothetical protein